MNTPTFSYTIVIVVSFFFNLSYFILLSLKKKRIINEGCSNINSRCNNCDAIDVLNIPSGGFFLQKNNKNTKGRTTDLIVGC